MAVAAVVGGLTWGALAGYFALVGRLGVAVHVLFAENVAYGGSLGANLASAVTPEHAYPECMTWIGLPALIVLLTLIGGRRSTPVPPWRLWIGWAVGTWVTVALPGRFFPHYYQCWIPPMCVAAGWAAARLLGGPWGIIRVTRSLAVAVVVVILAGRELLPYAWSADEWAAHKYTGDNFVEQAYLARRLDGLLRRDERFWVLGQDNTLYFLAQRSPVSGLLYLEQVDDPRTRSYWSRLIGDLDAGRPALVVVRLEWVKKISASAPILPWIRANYDPVATDLTCPSYGLWVHRGDDDLRQRLLHPPPAAPFRRGDSNFRP